MGFKSSSLKASRWGADVHSQAEPTIAILRCIPISNGSIPLEQEYLRSEPASFIFPIDLVASKTLSTGTHLDPNYQERGKSVLTELKNSNSNSARAVNADDAGIRFPPPSVT